MPIRRQRSFMGTPASASFNTPTICSSLKRLPFMALLLSGLYTRRSYVLAGLNFGGQVNFDAEVEHLLERLKRPGDGVEETLFLGLTRIDIDEVAARGIKRKRPASPSGEELRDVMIWLLVLCYATDTRSEVAFISNDSGFRIS